MSVVLSPPNQLGFPRPLTSIVKRSLFIHNPHSAPVAFKVKTTAPKQYCVRPNQGRVEPGEKIEVSIVLQPLPADPPPHAKCKDKFLVQSAFIPPEEEIGHRSLQELWATMERANKASIVEQKIRCAYLPAQDGSGDPNGIPEENEDSQILDRTMDDSLPPTHGYSRWSVGSERQFDSTLFPNGGRTVWELENTTPKTIVKPAPPSPPKPDVPKPEVVPEVVVPLQMPQQPPTFIVVPPLALYSHAEQSPPPPDHGTNGSQTLRDFGAPAAAGAGAAAVGIGGAGIAAAHSAPPAQPDKPKELPPLTADDVQFTNTALEKSVDASMTTEQKLNAALGEIDRLKRQLADQPANVIGLRQRGGGVNTTGAPGAATKVAQAPAQAASGVPVEVVAGLVLVVFVLTYLFF